MPELEPLPGQPRDVPYPTSDWPQSEPGPHVDRAQLAGLVERAFRTQVTDDLGETLALLAVQGGRVVLERYGPEHHADETFISWSMAKSITHALVGMLVEEGKLDPSAPAPVAAWQSPGDPRGKITLEHLLRMSDGLDFVEDYVDEGVSHVIQMLFQEGKEDVAGYAAARGAAHPPGKIWNYSSGTTNVVSALAGKTLGGEAGMRAFMQERLFDPLGMKSATARFDEAGTFIGSSFVYATARDFARFGLLYLRDGVWDGERLLPEGWVDHARTTTPGAEGEYGAHWWLRLVSEDAFHCSGYNGQYIVCVPSRDLVLVRLGLSSAEQRDDVRPWITEIADVFATRS